MRGRRGLGPLARAVPRCVLCLRRVRDAACGHLWLSRWPLQRHPWLQLDSGMPRPVLAPRPDSAIPKYRSALLGFHALSASEELPPLTATPGLKNKTKSLFSRALRSLTTSGDASGPQCAAALSCLAACCRGS
jgi:hypothetical protein